MDFYNDEQNMLLKSHFQLSTTRYINFIKTLSHVTHVQKFQCLLIEAYDYKYHRVHSCDNLYKIIKSAITTVVISLMRAHNNGPKLEMK